MEDKQLTSLLEKASYIGPVDRERIKKAYAFAINCHQNQKRSSGDPYISHPVEVAIMLAELRLDADSIIAGLLHDTIEDTHATLEDLTREFGQSVADLVNGLTKLSRIEIQSMFQKQAENFRKLVLAISADLRVLLIKLVDRLHNMRTIQYVRSPEGRCRIALETLEIYAPLAERIGMHAIQEELQNLSFAELNPDAHETIRRRIKYLYAEGKEIVTRAIEDLEHILKEGGVQAMVLGREKRPYSIWHKMQHRNISFEQLSDIIGFRVLVESNADCYQALGLIHNAYIVLPGRFKDYISTPKPNQYQSLHTTVLGPNHRKIEIQIRTHEMHRIAEYGVAAHWEYKNSPNKDGKKFRWLRGLLEILENATGAEEFLENTKLEMFQDKVYCFTPKGDLIELPKNSTSVDFAYAVHSKVGNHCKGVKINGKLMPLKTKLRSGDQVEILTSPSQHPSPLWERFVITGKARVSIRRYIRTEQRAEFLALGKSLLQQALPQQHSMEDRKLLSVLSNFHAETMEDLYFLIGNGQVKANDVVKFLSPTAPSTIQPLFQDFQEAKETLTDNKQKLPIKGLIPGMAIHLADCCHPIPGDQIYGWINPGKGVDVHTSVCEKIAEIDLENQQLIHLSWDVKVKTEMFTACVTIVLINKPGSLGITATTIAKNRGNITNIKVVQRTEEFMDLLTDIEVRDTRHLEDIMAALRTCTAVAQVTRDKYV